MSDADLYGMIFGGIFIFSVILEVILVYLRKK